MLREPQQTVTGEPPGVHAARAACQASLRWQEQDRTPDASRRLRVLFITELLPWPVDMGGRIRTYHVLRQAGRRADVTVVGQVPVGRPEATREIAALARVLHVIPQQPLNPALRAADAVACLLRGRAYLTAYRHHRRALAALIARVTATERFDLVHMDHLDAMVYLPDLARQMPIYLDQHNFETQLLETRRDRARGMQRMYFAHQARALARFEAAACRAADAVGVVSAVDGELVEEVAPGRPIVEVPNGVDLEYFDIPRRPRPGRVVSIGSLDWGPNVEGLIWFLQHVWPRIVQCAPDATFQIVGRGAPPALRAFEGPKVEITGWVPDVRPYATEASAFVVPLHAGGGTRLKVVEAFAMRLPVVATALGAQGIAWQDGRDIFIADDAEVFAGRVVGLLRDPAGARRMGHAARALAERLYGWETVGDTLERVYRTITTSSR
jgi:glycosyltransferase involved in cell wall biosynthesis